MHRRTFLAGGLTALAQGASAHELASNRATLVLRDKNHLAVTLYLNYVEVLHQVLAPQKPLQEFVLASASQELPALQRDLQTAQARLQSGISIALVSGKIGTLSQWNWPAAPAVQALLQQRAMQGIVAPGEHGHAPQAEVHAELVTAHESELSAVVLRLPPALGEVLVVSYRPKQTWARPGQPAPVIRF